MPDVGVTETAGATVTAAFTGNQVQLIGRAAPDGGLADVWIDGVKQLVFIDCWNPSPRRPPGALLQERLVPGAARAEDRGPRGQEPLLDRQPRLRRGRAVLGGRQALWLSRRHGPDGDAADGLRLHGADGLRRFARAGLAAGDGIHLPHGGRHGRHTRQLVAHARGQADRGRRRCGALSARGAWPRVPRERDGRPGDVLCAAEVCRRPRCGDRQAMLRHPHQRPEGGQPAGRGGQGGRTEPGPGPGLQRHRAPQRHHRSPLHGQDDGPGSYAGRRPGLRAGAGSRPWRRRPRRPCRCRQPRRWPISWKIPPSTTPKAESF